MYYILLLSFWDLISPFVSIVRQTGNGSDIFNYVYYFYIAFLVIYIIYRFSSKFSFNRELFYIVSLISLFILIGSFFNYSYGTFGIEYLYGQLFSWILFILIFLSYDKSLDRSFLKFNAIIFVPNILLNLVFSIIFRLELFGSNSYFTFDVSGILLSLSFLVRNFSLFGLIVLSIIAFIAMKRAILIIVLGYVLMNIPGFKLLLGLTNRRIFKFLIVPFLLLFIYFVSFLEIDLLFDSSIAERLFEIKYAFLTMSNFFNFLFGNGVGWYYQLSVFDPDESINRGFLHFSPAYLFISLGFLGLYLFYIFYSKILAGNAVYRNYTALQIFGILSLFMSLSRLNIVTDPIVILSLASLYRSKK